MIVESFKRWSANVPSKETVEFLARLGFTPYAFTFLSIAGKATALLLFLLKEPAWAGIPLFLEVIFDGLDGRMARAQKKETALGGLVDIVTDRFFRSSYYPALAYTGMISWEWAAIAIFLDLAMGALADAIRERKLRSLPFTLDTVRELPFAAPLGLIPLGLWVKLIFGTAFFLTNLAGVVIMNRRKSDIRPSV